MFPLSVGVVTPIDFSTWASLIWTAIGSTASGVSVGRRIFGLILIISVLKGVVNISLERW